MRDRRFTFLCTEEERQLLTDIAGYLQRSQGDSVRYLLRLFADDMMFRDMDGLSRPYENWRNDEQPKT